MKVLSLFDGISCGHVALDRAGVSVDAYLASEIKPSAIKVTMAHFPDTRQVGDVTRLHYEDGVLYAHCDREESSEGPVFRSGSPVFSGTIDLLMGGSPCQDFSLIKTRVRYGLAGAKSRLFYEYLRLLKETSPRYFLLENVKMKQESKKQLDSYLGVSGVLINSALVSYQNRPRVYWSNIPGISLPEDKHVNFQDYKETDAEKLRPYKVKDTPSRRLMWNEGRGHTFKTACRNITNATKIGCLTLKQDRGPNAGLIAFEDFCRYLTRAELEQAQTLPVGYTDGLTYAQAQNVLGDGWTVDVIAHIFRGLK